MRIIHIITRLAAADGGPAYCVVALSKAQAQAGDQVVILPCTSSGGKMVLEPGQYGNLTVLKPPLSGRVSFYEPILKGIMSEVIGNTDIVHIHGSWRYHFRAAAVVAQKRHIPYIVTPHGNLGRIPRRTKWYLKLPYYYLVNKALFQKASAVHSCAEKEKREMMDMKIPARHFVIPNPLPQDSFEIETPGRIFQDAFPLIPDTAQILLYLGRIASIKNLPMLLEAFIQIQDEFPHSHLILAGPHEFQKLVVSLQNRVEQAGLTGRVHFPGMVTGSLKTAVFQRSTVFILPSLHENFGISVAEAMFFGKPCVVNEGVALAEEIRSCKAGLVFNNNIDELASHLRQMLLSNKFRESCSLAAKKMADNFIPEKVASLFHTEYHQCIVEYNGGRTSTVI